MDSDRVRGEPGQLFEVSARKEISCKKCGYLGLSIAVDNFGFNDLARLFSLEELVVAPGSYDPLSVGLPLKKAATRPISAKHAMILLPNASLRSSAQRATHIRAIGSDRG